MPDIKGHDAQMARLSKVIACGYLPGAWIFSGPRAIGKACVAKRCAYAFLDPASVDSSAQLAVDEKSERVQRMRSGAAPDYLYLGGETDKGSNFLYQMESLRVIPRFFHHKHAEDKSIAILDDAHALSAAAANILLHALENLPRGAVFFLITPDRNKLPAPVVSRCRHIQFSALGPGDFSACVKELSADQQVSNLMHALGSGRPGCVDFFRDPAKRKKFASLDSFLSDIVAGEDAFGHIHALSAGLTPALWDSYLFCIENGLYKKLMEAYKEGRVGYARVMSLWRRLCFILRHDAHQHSKLRWLAYLAVA